VGLEVESIREGGGGEHELLLVLRGREEVGEEEGERGEVCWGRRRVQEAISNRVRNCISHRRWEGGRNGDGGSHSS